MNENANSTPRSLRIVITLIGRRNVGKSSLINSICGQNVSIVSDVAGTTTDAVAKSYELSGLGAVTFYDTAGLDDEGDLGQQRISATKKVLYKTDIAVLVIGTDGIQESDAEIVKDVREMKIPLLVVFNKTDISSPKVEDKKWVEQNNVQYVEVSAEKSENINVLKQKISDIVPEDLRQDPLLAGDLFAAGDVVVLVTPIDYSAPKGRLILPQVQVLREILDKGAKGIIVKETELESILMLLKQKPALIISDSQVIMKVATIVPQDVPLTTFSILFARNKGDIRVMYSGASAIDDLKDGDKVLIAEACSHHAMEDDIGKVKIPNWLKKYTGKNLMFDFCHGGDFPDNLEQYSLVIHCGACMINRTEMVRRLNECVRRGVKITNYGVVISKTQGVLERVVEPLKIKENI
ncbi:MAG: [FeFe] hydrogenase H-cluster maturation GTPase HydF [Alphaproteobacteria bacterium]|nr:[FeFe] hydrogenase H-cluster maturation GTPase HydF [Alphaproteobacteria bacterium]